MPSKEREILTEMILDAGSGHKVNAQPRLNGCDRDEVIRILESDISNWRTSLDEILDKGNAHENIEVSIGVHEQSISLLERIKKQIISS